MLANTNRYVVGAAAVASLSFIALQGCKDDDDDDDTPSYCVGEILECAEDGSTTETCCKSFKTIPAPGELGLTFPNQKMKLSYFELEPCTAFQFHFHNHPEGMTYLEGTGINPFILNAASVTTSPDFLAGAFADAGQGQVLPANGGHTYVNDDPTTDLKWLSLWPHQDFDTTFVWPGSADPSLANDGPIGAGKVTGEGDNKVCDLKPQDMTNFVDLDSQSALPFTLTDAENGLCFVGGETEDEDGQAQGKDYRYQSKLVSNAAETEIALTANCVYVLTKGKATWTIGTGTNVKTNNVEAITFIPAKGADMKLKFEADSQYYEACYGADEDNFCIDNNPWRTVLNPSPNDADAADSVTYKTVVPTQLNTVTPLGKALGVEVVE